MNGICEINILDLPNEIISRILSFICITEITANVITTCQKLFHISQHLINGRLTLHSKQNIDKIIKFLLGKKEISGNITYLILQNDESLFANMYERLEVTNSLLDYEVVPFNLGIMCPIPSRHIIQLLIDTCSNIKYFYWFGNSLDTVRRMDRDTPFSLPSLLRKCPKLQYVWLYDVFLDLKDTKSCDSNTENQLDFNIVFKKYCPELKMLKAINCHVLGSFENLKATTPETETTSWTLVREELKYIRSITFLDVGFQTKWHSHWNSSDCDMTMIPSNYNKSEIFHLNSDLMSNCVTQKDSTKDKEMGRYQRHLNSVILDADSAFIKERILVLIQDCINVEYLSFKSYYGFPWVNDNLLEQIGKSCKQLKFLNVNGCTQISDTGLNHIIKSCSKLKTLDASNTNAITNETLINISNHEASITSLIIQKCSNINDDGIQMIVKNCRKLKSLDVGGCTQLTNAFLKQLSIYSKELIFLGLGDLTQITIDHVDAVIRGCPKLKFLDFPFWDGDWEAKENKPDLNELFNIYEKLLNNNFQKSRPLLKIRQMCPRWRIEHQCNFKSGCSANIIDYVTL